MSRTDHLKVKAKLLQKSKKKLGKQIRLKDAYDILAKSAGYDSWRHMKEVVERHELFRPSNSGLPYWNNWFSSYEEALQSLGANQFLLPYENQFFVCGLDYIEALGIAKNDPDIELIGSNWVHPQDMEAFTRLLNKIKNRNARKN